MFEDEKLEALLKQGSNKTQKISKIFRNDSPSSSITSQNNANAPKARKLDFIRIKAKRREDDIFPLRTVTPNAKNGRDFSINS
ncbi:hypothetical protein TNCV_1122981 [Trichonephila clavipes]|uniref:Uncharacterized protein n=1 Tax=Trichonephila clavipes TaxID=2585209 RepID=A0A8X6VLK3_TRICX|nr:hypothetical protein TNCV_1122981 [Trichonephila clavipes]